MRRAKLFKNGQSQAVRLPKDFRFGGSEVYMKRLGNAVLLLPQEGAWETLIESTERFSDDFMAERTQPPVQARRKLSG